MSLTFIETGKEHIQVNRNSKWVGNITIHIDKTDYLFGAIGGEFFNEYEMETIAKKIVELNEINLTLLTKNIPKKFDTNNIFAITTLIDVDSEKELECICCNSKQFIKHTIPHLIYGNVIFVLNNIMLQLIFCFNKHIMAYRPIGRATGS